MLKCTSPYSDSNIDCMLMWHVNALRIHFVGECEKALPVLSPTAHICLPDIGMIYIGKSSMGSFC